MKRLLICFSGITLICQSVLASDNWFGIYLEGQKIGYSRVWEEPLPKGTTGRLSLNKTVLKSEMMGTALEMEITSRSDVTANGRPRKMDFVTTSSGRTQTISAVFDAKEVKVAIDNGGQKSSKTIPLPSGIKVVDDPTAGLVLEGILQKGTYKVHVLDPTTISLVENEVAVLGGAKLSIAGKEVQTTLVEVRDPRSTSKIYLSEKGDVVKIVGALGMEMLPEEKKVALAGFGSNRIDLGETAAIKVSPGLPQPQNALVVTYKISGENLPTIPSDAYQSATKNPDGSIILKVNPTFPDPKSSKTLGEVGVNAQTYLKPSMHIPSDQKRFKDLAKQIVGTETNAAKAMRLISVWVGEKIGVNAGIGVLRDANEVLDSKEGVCRDNAILAATLLRASGIPTKVISGLIYDQQAMYYHAWNECWDGKRWVLIDSTRPRTDQNALRIKLGQGNVEEAFLFTVLTRAKVEVLNVKYRS